MTAPTVCSHGRLERQCETCAAWESAIYNQTRAEHAEAERDAALARVQEVEGVNADLTERFGRQVRLTEMAEHIVSVQATRADQAEAENARLREALRESVDWHERQRSNEPGDSPLVDGWRAALAGAGTGAEANPATCPHDVSCAICGTRWTR